MYLNRKAFYLLSISASYCAMQVVGVQTQTAMPKVVSLCGLNSFLRHLQSDVGIVRMLGVTLMSLYCDVFMFILGYS